MSTAIDLQDVYGGSYYDDLRAGMRRSAEVLVPVLIDLFRPESVVDVGCGVGEWLAAFANHGIDDVLGIDGPHVDHRTLAVELARFVGHDLQAPVRMDRRFDLVLCLEVAEHLSADAGDVLIESLTGLGDVIVFSAAIPGQGGEHHVNEQWPDYWHRRFKAHGLHVYDCLRWRIWADPSVDWWYAQNALVFSRGPLDVGSPVLESPPAIVHPRLYHALIEERRLLHRIIWTTRCELLEQSIRAAIPAGGGYALVGAERLQPIEVEQRVDVTLRSSEPIGSLDDALAVARRVDRDAPPFVVVAWPAFGILGPGSDTGPTSIPGAVLQNEACVIIDAQETAAEDSR